MSSATQNEITVTPVAQKRVRIDANPPTDGSAIGQGSGLLPIRRQPHWDKTIADQVYCCIAPN
jgi:hypothetical protein